MPSGNENQISIALTPAQVELVVRSASGSSAPGIAALISGALRVRPADTDGQPRADPRLSRSLLRGLSILGCFDAPGQERGIVELARDAGISVSTTHRYALTLIELGLLERSPSTRRYRLASLPPA